MSSLKPSGIREFFDLVLNRKNVLSLGVGEPDYPTPWHVTEQAIYSLEKGYTSYTSNQGLLSLRQAICNYLRDRFNAHYDAVSEIIITVGVSEAVDLTFRAILDEGDEVILPVPGYVCYEPLVTMAGGRPVVVNTSHSGFILTRAQIEPQLTDKTRAILINYPNNPTGTMISREALLDLIELARERDLWLISDEVYAELIYESDPRSASTFEHDHLILLNGFSKSYAMTGWRVGYTAAPPVVTREMLKIHQYNALCAPIMSQYAALEAIKNGAKEVEKMRLSYEQRRNFFSEGLREIGFELETPGGAFYMFPKISSFGLNSRDFALGLLKQSNVAVVPGTAFGEGLDDYIRCCYACSMDDLKEALRRIKGYVETLR